MFSRRQPEVAAKASGEKKKHRTIEHRRRPRDEERKESRRSIPCGSEAEAVAEERSDGSLLPWRRHPTIDGWVERNTRPHRRFQRDEGALIVVGPPFAGKTWWARSFGEHVCVSAIHSSRLMHATHDGYAVFNDMSTDYGYAKQILSRQTSVTVALDEGSVGRLAWGRACIWTCSGSDDPRKWSPEMAEFVKENCTVFDMYDLGWETLYTAWDTRAAMPKVRHTEPVGNGERFRGSKQGEGKLAKVKLKAKADGWGRPVQQEESEDVKKKTRNAAVANDEVAGDKADGQEEEEGEDDDDGSGFGFSE